MIFNTSNTSIMSDYIASEDPNIRYKLYIIVPIIWSLIIIFGIIGNGLIVYVILKRRLYKNSCTNCYIINVSIADLCFTIACVPVTMTAYVYNEWKFGSFMCQFQNLIMFSSVQATCLTLTAMTVDRYLAVLYPFKSIEYRTTKLAFAINIAIWLASFSLNIPYFIYYNQVKLSNVTYCISRFPEKEIEIGLTLYTVLISYFLPLMTIIFCYMRMIIKIYSKSGDQKLVEQSKNFSGKQEHNFKASQYRRPERNQNKSDACVKFDQNGSEVTNFFSQEENSDSETIHLDSRKKESLKFDRLKRNNLLIKEERKSFVRQTNSTKTNAKTHANSALTIKKQKFKILLLIATVSFTFALTWLPAHVIQIWKVVFNSSFPYNDAMYIIKVISHTLTYSNSLLNPFIYVFIGAKFRSHIYSEFNELYQVYCLRQKKINSKNSLSKMSSAGSSMTVLNRNRLDKYSTVCVIPNNSFNKINSRRL